MDLERIHLIPRTRGMTCVAARGLTPRVRVDMTTNALTRDCARRHMALIARCLPMATVERKAGARMVKCATAAFAATLVPSVHRVAGRAIRILDAVGACVVGISPWRRWRRWPWSGWCAILCRDDRKKARRRQHDENCDGSAHARPHGAAVCGFA